MPELLTRDRGTSVAAPDLPSEGRTGRLGAILTLTLTVILVLAGAWVFRPSGDDGGSGAAAPPDRAAIGDEAPEFSGIDLGGRTVSSESLAGKPYWITFGATWCAACRIEAPDIEKMHQETGITVVQVYNREDSAAVRDFVARLGLSTIHVPDETGRIAAEYAVNGIPAHFFVDASGVIREARVGALSASQMSELIEEIQPG